MQLAKVIGSMVSTRKSDRLHGLKLLVAVPIDMDTFEEKGAPFITVDTVGAGMPHEDRARDGHGGFYRQIRKIPRIQAA